MSRLPLGSLTKLTQTLIELRSAESTLHTALMSASPSDPAVALMRAELALFRQARERLERLWSAGGVETQGQMFGGVQ